MWSRSCTRPWNTRLYGVSLPRLHQSALRRRPPRAPLVPGRGDLAVQPAEPVPNPPPGAAQGGYTRHAPLPARRSAREYPHPRSPAAPRLGPPPSDPCVTARCFRDAVTGCPVLSFQAPSRAQCVSSIVRAALASTQRSGQNAPIERLWLLLANARRHASYGYEQCARAPRLERRALRRAITPVQPLVKAPVTAVPCLAVRVDEPNQLSLRVN